MDDLIALYQEHLNLQDACFTRIDHDDAMVADVYKITQPTGMQLILKICTRREDYLREAYFLKQLANQLPLPQLIKILPPEVGVYGAILMEYLPGALLKIIDFTNSLAHQLGTLLATLHLNQTAGYGDLTQPQNLSPNPRHHFTLKFEEGFAECRNHLPETLLKASRSYYDNHVHLLDYVDGPCIIHRDFRPGNVIVDTGKVRGIIDWSSARASFTEDDFCSMEHTEWSQQAATKQAFLNGYASVRPVPKYDLIMPLLRLSRAFATIGFTVKRNTWASSCAKPYQFNRQFLEMFLTGK